MDLYKHAFRLWPLVGSDFVADCFELAWAVRTVARRRARARRPGRRLRQRSDCRRADFHQQFTVILLTVRLARLSESEFRQEDLADVRFVPLIGKEGWAVGESASSATDIPTRKESRRASGADCGTLRTIRVLGDC